MLEETSNVLKYMVSRKDGGKLKPTLIVPIQIKKIFPGEKNILIRKTIESCFQSQISKESMELPSFPSFNNSQENDSPKRKTNVSKQSHLLDQKLSEFVMAIERKSSFEEPTILHPPHHKKLDFERDDTSKSSQLDFIRLLKESMNTEDMGLITERKRISKKDIVYDKEVFDIYDPEFSSDDEKIKAKPVDNRQKSVSYGGQKTCAFEEKVDSNNVQSVYFDHQFDFVNVDLKHDENFALYSIKLTKKPAVKNNRSIQTNRHVNFLKKSSVYESLRDPGKFIRGFNADREQSPKRKLTLTNRDSNGKISIEKHNHQTPIIGKKNSAQKMKPSTTEVYPVYKIEHSSITKNKRDSKRNLNELSVNSQRIKHARFNESPQFGRFLFGNKRKDLQFF